jgi:hypothetical protein
MLFGELLLESDRKACGCCLGSSKLHTLRFAASWEDGLRCMPRNSWMLSTSSMGPDSGATVLLPKRPKDSAWAMVPCMVAPGPAACAVRPHLSDIVSLCTSSLSNAWLSRRASFCDVIGLLVLAAFAAASRTKKLLLPSSLRVIFRFASSLYARASAASEGCLPAA